MRGIIAKRNILGEGVKKWFENYPTFRMTKKSQTRLIFIHRFKSIGSIIETTSYHPPHISSELIKNNDFYRSDNFNYKRMVDSLNRSM